MWHLSVWCNEREFSARRFETVDELFLVANAFSRGFSADFLQTLFLEWERRFQI
jgi:hypothetical protein